MTVATHPRALRPDSLAIRTSSVETVGGLKVPPAFPWRRRHARHCLPALLRMLSWVPWALVPHASGQGLPPAPRYCALLRLPSSIPVGLLLAPFRYLRLMCSSLCPTRLAPGSVRLLSTSDTKRQGVVPAGHPCSGSCSQGDVRFSRVPGLPICPHAPLSDPGGILPARLGANRIVAFQFVQTVGFETGCPVLSQCPPLYIFRGSMTRPVFSPYLCFGHRLSAIALRFGCRPGG
jgi:hypothetical protein